MLQFGPEELDGPMEALSKLQQFGIVQEYYTKLFNLVDGMSGHHIISCFVSGLRDEIKQEVSYKGLKPW